MAGPRRRPPKNDARPAAGIINELIERRHALQLTQEYVADFAGISRAALHAMETGMSSPRLNTVLAVADALGCALVVTTKAAAKSRKAGS
jgi:DNA-binding XRE family transcriptional regulator